MWKDMHADAMTTIYVQQEILIVFLNFFSLIINCRERVM